MSSYGREDYVADPNVENNKFKAASGAYLTQSLFIDFAAYINKSHLAIYTVRDVDYTRDGITYPSLKKAFLSDTDITGYTFANKYLDGWKHYVILRNSAKLAPYFDDWEAEKEVKLMSIGMKNIMTQVADGNFSAAKWASDKGWIAKRGRPSKAEKAKKLNQKHAVIEQLSSGMRMLKENE